MDSFFHGERFRTEPGYAEYVNLSLITMLSAVLYIAHGIVFFLYVEIPLLIITQIAGVAISVGAFIVNRVVNPRMSSIMMIALICTSIIIWAYCVDVGSDMRWYAILALCPMYFFSVLNFRDKVILTAVVMLSFCSSTVLTYFHEPLAYVPNSAMYNTVACIVIFGSVALEMVLYKFVNSRRDRELKRVGTILDNIDCGIAIADAQTLELLDINPTAERMFGGEKSAILGKKLDDLISSADELPAGEDSEIRRAERRLVRADGLTVPILTSSAKIWYSGSMAQLESFTDITDLKEAEKKLRMLEIVEQSNRAKSEFLSRMSHEMRTPMNAIIGMTKIAEGSDDIERLKYCLSMIEGSSAHLLSLINDILDMSKIEAGKLELENAPLSLEKILVKISVLMHDSIAKKRIRFGIFLGPGTGDEFIGDELRLTQVLVNLMSNAVKFTEDGGEIRLSAELLRKTSDGGVLKFTVSDTGIGMTDDQISRLFNAFEQADGSITRKYGGTGLGLAISKSIVEKMDGRIWVQSSLGAGSSFHFEVELRRTGAPAQPELSFPAGTRVLIIDPDAEAGGYLGDIVRRYGISADVAENITGAALSNAYDIVFFACDSMDFAADIPAGTDKDSVVLTAPLHIWSELEGAAREAGFRRYLTKPVFPTAVADLISGFIGGNLAVSVSKTLSERETPDLSGVTLLLAEDVAINREIFITLLEETGVEIDVAENGLEAVRMFGDNPDRYTVIVMDIQMPVMNGYEATKTIRAAETERAKSIPIIAMTADAFREDIEKCLECGMNDHLKKPIEMDVVIEKLLYYCGKTKVSVS